jgi:hypothetical protein
MGDDRELLYGLGYPQNANGAQRSPQASHYLWTITLISTVPSGTVNPQVFESELIVHLFLNL